MLFTATMMPPRFLIWLLLCAQLYTLLVSSYCQVGNLHLKTGSSKRCYFSRMSAIEHGDHQDEHRYQSAKHPSSVYELNRMFRLSSSAMERILEPTSTGYAGVIVSLDNAMVDMSRAIGYSYAILAGDLNEATPDPLKVRDLVGSTFRDFTIGLGWNIPAQFIGKYEERYFDILSTVVNKLPIAPLEGTQQLIRSLLDEKNEVTVVTSLRKDIALSVLGKTRLCELFEGRVPPDHLICHELPPTVQNTELSVFDSINSRSGADTYMQISDENYGDRYINKRFLQCCTVMHKPPMACVLIDGNRRHVVGSKKFGMSCIAISGYAINGQFLRSADLVSASLESARCRDVYKLVQRAVRQEQGPELQTQTVPERARQQTLQVTAPAASSPRTRRKERKEAATQGTPMDVDSDREQESDIDDEGEDEDIV